MDWLDERARTKRAASLEASPHNPNLLQVEIKDILDTAAAAAAVRI